MEPEKPFTLDTYGSLNLKTTHPTLKQLEDFCAEARRLGLGDNTRIDSTRQGLMGPIVGWHFMVPVIPKPPETSRDQSTLVEPLDR